MVQNSSLPSLGDDGAEPIVECPAFCGSEALDVLIRVAPVLKYHSFHLAGGDRELRKDLLQEGSFAVVRAVTDFNPAIGKLDGYAADRAIKRMGNVCRKHRRRLKRISYLDPQPSENEPGLDPLDPATEQCASCAADYVRIRELIPAVLTSREQQVIRSRYYGYLNVSQTARKLRLSKGRISQLEGTALIKLRLALEDPVTSHN